PRSTGWAAWSTPAPPRSTSWARPRWRTPTSAWWALRQPRAPSREATDAERDRQRPGGAGPRRAVGAQVLVAVLRADDAVGTAQHAALPPGHGCGAVPHRRRHRRRLRL